MRPASESAPAFLFAVTPMHPLESMGKKDGTILGRGTYEVSDDGQTMTATVSGIDAAGKPFEQVIVFDRG